MSFSRQRVRMKPPHDDSIWPDDTRRAAVALALAAATDSDMQFQDMIDSIESALGSGRGLQFVMELIRLLTAELGDQFGNPTAPRLTGSSRPKPRRTKTICVPAGNGGKRLRVCR
ncbi:hypothetical protein AWB89_07800 [Mycobacterium paraense]|nr:hypothetical protein AWB89_07800 [Mycobacterium paraense]